jgi:hypothetical protein
VDLRQLIEKNSLEDAISDLATLGRHWFTEAAPAASMLETLVKERGYNAILLSLPPDWEYVLALTDQSLDEVEKIAKTRAIQHEEGVPVPDQLK